MKKLLSIVLTLLLLLGMTPAAVADGYNTVPEKTAYMQTLSASSALEQSIGSFDANSIVNEMMGMLGQFENMSDEEIRQQINSITSAYNVELDDKQLDQIVSLARSHEDLDPSALQERMEDVKEKISKIAEAKDKIAEAKDKIAEARTKVAGFMDSMKGALSSVRGFFTRLKDFIGL